MPLPPRFYDPLGPETPMYDPRSRPSARISTQTGVNTSAKKTVSRIRELIQPSTPAKLHQTRFGTRRAAGASAPKTISSTGQVSYAYSRDGQFTKNSAGQLANSAGYVLLGYPVDENGNPLNGSINTVSDLEPIDPGHAACASGGVNNLNCPVQLKATAPIEPIVLRTAAGEWGNAVLDFNEAYEPELAERAAIFARDPGRHVELGHMRAASWDALLHLLSEAAATDPAMTLNPRGDREFQWENARLGVARRFRFGDEDSLGEPPLRFAASQVPDDVVLLDEREGRLFADAGVVTFASNWSIRFVLGMSFTELHGPVPRDFADGAGREGGDDAVVAVGDETRGAVAHQEERAARMEAPVVARVAADIRVPRLEADFQSHVGGVAAVTAVEVIGDGHVVGGHHAVAVAAAVVADVAFAEPGLAGHLRLDEHRLSFARTSSDFPAPPEPSSRQGDHGLAAARKSTGFAIGEGEQGSDTGPAAGTEDPRMLYYAAWRM